MAMLARYVELLDQRFPQSQEKEFVQSFQWYFAAFAIFWGSGMTAGWVYSALHWEFDFNEPYRGFLSALFIVDLIVPVGSMILIALRHFPGWFRSFNLEYLAVICTCYGFVSTACGTKWYSACLFGRDPYGEWGPQVAGSANFLGLHVMAYPAMICLLLPMRSNMSWMVTTFGLILYLCVTFVASQPFPFYALHNSMIVVCMIGTVQLGGIRNEFYSRQRWLSDRQVQKHMDLSEKERQGFFHLLMRLCDCLIQLGSDFKIKAPSPNLQAMLFLNDTLQGACFCDLLASAEDRHRFIAAVGKGMTEEEHAGLMPLHLRDALAREVQVHVYYTSYTDEADDPCHIVGIIEAPGREEAVGPLPVNTTIARQIAVSGSHLDESSDSDSELTLESVTGPDLGEIAVTFDDSQGFKLRSCTQGFKSLYGADADNVHFLDCLKGLDMQADFTDYIQNCVRDFRDAGHLSEVVLRKPKGTCAAVECAVYECVVVAVWFHQDSEANAVFSAEQCRIQIDFERLAVPETSCAHEPSDEIVSLTFDGNLEIISCSPGFTKLCGPIADDSKYSDWIVDSSTFKIFVQDIVNTFFSCYSIGRILLTTPIATKSGIMFLSKETTLASIRLPPLSGTLSDPCWVFRVVFSSIRQTKLKQGSTHSAVLPRHRKTRAVQSL
mmetsp:Transcript_94629/g.203133  ORF Transcript_94629/g.203133 Transcript_94629/m.203133 type:complete len:665 (-) Transcript_94629:108-2102(-)